MLSSSEHNPECHAIGHRTNPYSNYVRSSYKRKQIKIPEAWKELRAHIIHVITIYHNGESSWSEDADDFIEVAEKKDQCLLKK